MTTPAEPPQPPQGDEPAAQPDAQTAPQAAAQPAPEATPQPAPQAPPAAAAWPQQAWPQQAWPGAWPAGAPAPAQPRRHSAWIRTMTPLTAGALSVLLILAGFGLGVVVGWQHDGHGPQRVVFEPGQRRLQQPPRNFGDGPYFNGPNRQRPGQQNPSPSPTSPS